MGILVRSGPLSHPEVSHLLERYFVPVAIDVANYKRKWADIRESSDSEIVRFSAASTPMPVESDIQIFRDIDQQATMSQGIWITTPDGKLLRNFYAVQPHILLATMKAAIADWKSLRNAEPLALPDSAALAAEATPKVPGSVRLLFFGRLADEWSHTIFRDSAYSSAALWQDLLSQETSAGDAFDCPDALLELVASRIYPGELRLIVRQQEFKQRAASFQLREIRDGIAVAELRGEVSMEGTFPFSSRRRQYEGRLRGELTWRVQPRELVSFRIISDGNWQAEYPGGLPAAAMDIYPGGMVPRPLAMSPPMRLMFLVEVPQSDRSF